MNINAVFPQYYIGSELDTYNSREELKRLGFKWDPNKKAWWHKDRAERDAAELWLDERDDDIDTGEHDDWGARDPERWDSPRSWR